MLVYATPDDYLAWTQTTEAPANLASVLRSASLAVQEATELCFYVVDSTGAPTDPKQLQAFNDATCCQAAAMVALGLDGTGAIEASVETSTGIGTARMTFATQDANLAVTVKAQVLSGLVTDAQRILRAAGVTPTAPWVVG